MNDTWPRATTMASIGLTELVAYVVSIAIVIFMWLQ
jgi:hypothetical protein